jgi:5-oxoprolinase (ATP-hydrolysing) subunit A
MKKLTVDLNCDLGESFGAYKMGQDDEILDHITSANIACGFHAGDPAIMKKTVKSALKKGVTIGAHPGFPDLQGFGRRIIAVRPEEAYDLVVYQIGALAAFAKSEGRKLAHVKPHGALYNMASVDSLLAEAIAEAVYKVDPELVFFGLAGSEMIKAGERIGLKTASEVFADRSYQSDGTLTLRRSAEALITDHNKAVDQVIKMVKEEKVISQQGLAVHIKAETISIHGDGPHALDFAVRVKNALIAEGVEIKAIR